GCRLAHIGAYRRILDGLEQKLSSQAGKLIERFEAAGQFSQMVRFLTNCPADLPDSCPLFRGRLAEGESQFAALTEHSFPLAPFEGQFAIVDRPAKFQRVGLLRSKSLADLLRPLRNSTQ